MVSRSFALIRTYRNNGGPVTEVGKRVIDVGELDLSGLEGAAAGLEVWVLVAHAELLGEVLRQANLVLAVEDRDCNRQHGLLNLEEPVV